MLLKDISLNKYFGVTGDFLLGTMEQEQEKRFVEIFLELMIDDKSDRRFSLLQEWLEK